jgi:hypothetical protein
MANLKGVVSVVAQLKNERANLRKQLEQVDEALSALGGLNGRTAHARPRHRMSVAARRRIAAAQRARWAKVRASKKPG